MGEAIKLYESGVYLFEERDVFPDDGRAADRLAGRIGRTPDRGEAERATLSWPILESHNLSGDMNDLKIRFDALASHDITYVGIIQTARASGLERFPVPYVLTNCHNSLCAVGGTINEDDHLFAVSAARKYGGIYVPAHLAVIHQYMRETLAGCGRMILGSDSHTRYGALGCLAVGEGGGELAKQLLGRTYDLGRPEATAVLLKNRPEPGVGPQDVALALIARVFAGGLTKNRVLEFVGDGVAGLPVEYRHGIDVMTTETACLSSVWTTDEKVGNWLAEHGRPGDYARLRPGRLAYYHGLIEVDLSKIRPMVALPFHPANAYPIRDFMSNAGDILRGVEKEAERLFGPVAGFSLVSKLSRGGLMTDQGVVGGCAGGGADNLAAVADILRGRPPGPGAFSLNVYPASQPILVALARNGVMDELLSAGVVVRSAFCGPCFGAGDVPGHGCLSIRHATRNFPNREGSRPGEGQLAAVALMDARSIAATAARGGILTPADDEPAEAREREFRFDGEAYRNRVYQGFGRPEPEHGLRFGPNIADWPAMPPLPRHLLLTVASFISDPVTTTDELIPSGETSAYRSNPERLAEFTLQRRDPGYVTRAKAARAPELVREGGGNPADGNPGLAAALARAAKASGLALNPAEVGLGSAVHAEKPGDGSAREQAASCQKVLGGWANLAREYATRRYRSNLINWGVLPLLLEGEPPYGLGSLVFLPDIRKAVLEGGERLTAYALGEAEVREFSVSLGELGPDERRILADGCLINFYRKDSAPVS